MWEDDANKMGGRWLISLEKKQRNSDLDRFWLDVVCNLSFIIDTNIIKRKDLYVSMYVCNELAQKSTERILMKFSRDRL